MPSKKTPSTGNHAHELHKRCGVLVSGPRAKHRMRKTVGRKTRMTGYAGLCLAAMTQAVLEQVIREAGSHLKSGKSMVKPIHLAKALNTPNSMVKGVLPSKVAGIYMKSL